MTRLQSPSAVWRNIYAPCIHVTPDTVALSTSQLERQESDGANALPQCEGRYLYGNIPHSLITLPPGTAIATVPTAGSARELHRQWHGDDTCLPWLSWNGIVVLVLIPDRIIKCRVTTVMTEEIPFKTRQLLTTKRVIQYSKWATCFWQKEDICSVLYRTIIGVFNFMTEKWYLGLQKTFNILVKALEDSTETCLYSAALWGSQSIAGKLLDIWYVI